MYSLCIGVTLKYGWGGSIHGVMCADSTESFSENLATQRLFLVPVHKAACLEWGLGGYAPALELRNQPPEACESILSQSRPLFLPLVLYKEMFIEPRQDPQERAGKPEGTATSWQSLQSIHVQFKHRNPGIHSRQKEHVKSRLPIILLWKIPGIHSCQQPLSLDRGSQILLKEANRSQGKNTLEK